MPWLLLAGVAALLLYVAKSGLSGSGSVQVDKNSVVVGTIRRTGGSASWRARNPGNITWSTWAKSMGALGSMPWNTGKQILQFAIWPSDDAGFSAIVKLLQTDEYAQLTLAKAIKRWTGSDPRDNSTAYAQQVSQSIGAALTTPMVELSASQLVKMAETIQDVEGWTKGEEASA
jgi:hypothetical protein